ncbi:hypothetical protein DL762_001236 [Monosporascus cannonballus]|uniref:Amino acid permease/ SLC12A domain-containing protein n=1 Tax=Monosporascus cannonballus TaxID=155416 RepID=A0ABY0HHN3_9PEZI|nr:hypothetical protein DL762_001236 [Monosporascus cannonballus]
MGVSKFWARSGGQPDELNVIEANDTSSADVSVIRDGGLAYTVERAENGSKPSWQEANGAPVELRSPLGYHVGWLTVIFLNVNQMIGTGIFSTPGSILNSTGSVGLALIYWFIGFLMACSGVCVFLELASYFPNRSGAEVVYLEQAYPRPKHFFPVAFAVQSVILSFSSSNAVVLSRYVWRIAGRTPTDWEMKGIALAAYTFAVILVIVHNKYSLWLTNIFGGIKIITLVFISITGFVVLGGGASRIGDSRVNFRNSFEGMTNNGNDLANALVNIVFSYTGYNNAFNVVNEIKNPIPTLKRNVTISVCLVAVLYMLCNIAYFAAVPKQEFAESKEIAAAVFFTAVFGRGGAEQALNVLVLLSAFGNLLAVLIGQSRIIREIGRLRSYPQGLFYLAMAIGVYLIRYRHKRAGRQPPEFRTWDPVLIFFTLIQVYIIAMPWWPPAGGPYAGDVSFWYATYCVVGIAVIVLCAVYYVIWMHLLPKWRGYRIRTEVLAVDDNGANTHRLIQVPLSELAAWDRDHDDAGRLRRRHAADSDATSRGGTPDAK